MCNQNYIENELQRFKATLKTHSLFQDSRSSIPRCFVLFLIPKKGHASIPALHTLFSHLEDYSCMLLNLVECGGRNNLNYFFPYEE